MKYAMRLLEAISYDFYKNKIDINKFNELVGLDLTPTKKYARWIVDTFLRNPNDYRNSTSDMLGSFLPLYDKYKNANLLTKEEGDIMRFKSYLAFSEFMDSHMSYFDKELKRKADEKNAKKDVKVLFKNNEHLLVTPLSHEASCKYGAKTKWCTTMDDPYHYKHYTDAGTLYIHRFFDEKGAFADEAYQLFIPDGTSNTYNEIELNNQRNNTVDDLDDFLEGLPDEIADDIREKVEEAGGFDSGSSFISGGCYSDIENDVVDCSYYYSLMKDYHGNWEIEDDGDETTYSSFKVMKIGKNYDSEEAQPAYEVEEEFVLSNGEGIYVQMNGVTRPEDANNAATHKWHDADNNSMEVDDYEFNHNLEQLLGKGQKYDYIIINHSDGLDDVIKYALDDYFDYYTPYDTDRGRREVSHDTKDVIANGNSYTIYYQLDYNYQTPESPPTSSKFQRRIDRQNDLPFGL